MKSISKTILALVFIGSMAFSCSSDKDEPEQSQQLTETPTAIKKFDSSNFGTYKGVFIGSTGTIEINQDENTKTAHLVIDGKEYIYTATENSTIGQETVGLTFKNGESSFDFNVGASGEEPNITNISIVGHANASIEIQKEKSDKIVKCYVGISTDEDGKSNPAAFNFCILGEHLIGIAHNDSGTALIVTGTVTNNTITGIVEYTKGTVEANIIGTIEGEKAEGTWANIHDDNGFFKTVRVL
ncbi:hypothetical protein [Flavobacterium sp. 5]|uniref:hypothetical protein n=1 Tax=Flavobacterium sp. 5 TaxID=2035199 RepID=UPI000C2BF560|nr:hypothetical protein [Flavobacterium sp. 5]PKB16661.1 hypothetical protein CLU82_1805 [Flavobacterium sp. 5]